MELPLGGPALRHYTQSRPRPHRQKLNYRPTRPQETIIESENEVLEFMGRVDEGVEEFFTKRVLPPDTPKTQEEESITVHEVVPASSAPCPPATKTLRRKLGDFFTLKKRRGLKSETSQEGRPKKASIADFIRPLKEVGRADKEKDKDRVKEADKENEKEKTCHPSAVAGEVAVQETPVSGAPPLRGEAVPPRRALREGKSQSLILLSGSAAAGTTNAKNAAKKQLDGQNSFEQKLHLMLQRIGVSKAHPGDTQNQEGEMKKADSEGTIIDSKPEPPPTFTKPRTMSASSDTRHQIRPSVSAHESAGKPALLPKPVLKPGPPPATSGRNTPENELAQIQEGETNTPTKLSPSATLLAPAVPTLTDSTPPTILTMSNSAPDSTTSTTPPSGTVTPSDPDACTDFVNSTSPATTPTNIPELDSKPSVSEAKASPGSPAALVSPAAPPEPPATVLLTSTPSESVSPSPSANSNVTTTTPPMTNSKTVSAPSSHTSIDTTSTDQSTMSAFREPDGALAVDATPDADGPPVVTADPSPPSSVAQVSAATSSVSETREDSTSSSTSTSSVTLVSSVTKQTSPTPDSRDTITSEPPITSISSLVSSAPVAATSTPSTTITSPASNNCVDSTSTSTGTHSAIPGSADISTPSTSSSDTNPTDTTTTTTSLNHADTTSTTSSGTSAAISSPLQTDPDPDPPYSNDVSTTLTPTTSGPSTTGDPSATSHRVSGPVLSSQASPEERSSVEPAETSAADEELEMIEQSKQTETDQSKPVDATDGKDSGSERVKSALVDSKEVSEEEQEESVEPEGDAAEQEVGTADPAAGKDGEMYSKEGLKGDHKQEETETESVHEK